MFDDARLRNGIKPRRNQRKCAAASPTYDTAVGTPYSASYKNAIKWRGVWNPGFVKPAPSLKNDPSLWPGNKVPKVGERSAQRQVDKPSSLEFAMAVKSVGIDNYSPLDIPNHTHLNNLEIFSHAISQSFVNSPKIIDYLSLDVEGAETRILERFPFDKYTFLTLTIERPTLKLEKLLFQNGYVFVKKSKKNGKDTFDSFYVHKSIPNYDNIKKEKYSPTPRKDW